MQHASQFVSSWVIKHAAIVGPGARLLDVACGYGRHARFFVQRGVLVTAVDCDAAALESLRGIENIACELRDLEARDSPWPYAAQSFDAVLVCNYLWRPTLDALLSTINVGGVLLYETFMDGNERYGKPSRPDFLLRANELIERTRDRFRVLAYEEGEQHAENGEAIAVKAQIAAIRTR